MKTKIEKGRRIAEKKKSMKEWIVVLIDYNIFCKYYGLGEE